MPLLGLHERFPIVSTRRRSPRHDYEAICASYLGATLTPRIDCGKVHRFAPKLNARQLRNTCVALRDDDGLDTERFVEYLREHHMASNVDIAEVQAVELKDLKGVDDVIEALEANVIMPLENAEVAQELGLQPKRGVLLAGPSGNRQDDDRPGARPPAQEQVLPARRDGHQRHAGLLPARPPHLRGRQAERAVRSSSSTTATSSSRAATSGAVSLPADDAGWTRERERGPHLSDDDGDGRRQPAAGAGPVGPHRAVAGDAAARRAGARGTSCAILRPAAGVARRCRRRCDRRGDRRPGRRRPEARRRGRKAPVRLRSGEERDRHSRSRRTS